MANIDLLLGLILVGSLQCNSHEISTRKNDGIKSYAGHKVFRADVSETQLPVVDSMETLSPGVKVWSRKLKGRSPERLYELDVLSPPDQEKQVLQVFNDNQLPYIEIIHDLQDVINKEQSGEFDGVSPKTPHSMTWSNYHSTEDLYDYMRWLEDNYPQYVTVIDIGKTFEGRSLLVAKISDSSKTSKPAIWVDGGFHAREWISPATVMYLLNRLVEYHWEFKNVTGMFDWYIMPLANPDGYEYTRLYDRLWRKNCAINPNNKCIGVDLNRNFDICWSQGGSSMDPCSETYSGPTAESEPETQAIRNFIMAHKDQLKVYVSIHAFSQMWMFPYSATYDVPDNYDDLYDVGRMATEAISKHSETRYNLGSVTEILYVASGDSGDFAYATAGIPFSYSVELRDHGHYRFILPKEQILPTGIETYEGIRAMAAGVLDRLPKYEKNTAGGLSRDNRFLTQPNKAPSCIPKSNVWVTNKADLATSSTLLLLCVFIFKYFLS